jgi:hypothetical protein
VRTDVVEFIAEVVEPTLLSWQASSGRPGRFVLEGLVHPFVAAILLGFPGLDEFREYAEANPPSRERGETGKSVSGEGDAVVGADSVGESEFIEEAGEDGFGAENSRGMEGLAANKVAAEVVGDGEGEAIDAVDGFELALEIRAPKIVGSRGGGGGGGFTGMSDATMVSAEGHRVIAFEDILDGGPAGKIPGRVGAMDNGKDLLAAPGGVLSA